MKTNTVHRILVLWLGSIAVGCTQAVTPQSQTSSPPIAQTSPSPVETPTTTASATPTPVTQTPQAQSPQAVQSLDAPTTGNRDRGKINFAAGSSSATVEGNLASKAVDQFTFDATANQTGTITIDSQNQNVLLTLVAPSGSPIQRYQSGQSSWSGTLPESGTYRISAVATQQASYKLTLTIAQKKSGT